MPYGTSTLLTLLVTRWEKEHQFSGLAAIALVWMAENGGYYLTTWLCDKFAPAKEKVLKEGSESLKQLLLVEGMDTAVRCSLLWLASLLPAGQDLAAATSSLAADISFALTLNKSHCLLEIFVRSGKTLREYYNQLYHDYWNNPVLELGLITR